MQAVRELHGRTEGLLGHHKNQLLAAPWESALGTLFAGAFSPPPCTLHTQRQEACRHPGREDAVSQHTPLDSLSVTAKQLQSWQRFSQRQVPRGGLSPLQSQGWPPGDFRAKIPVSGPKPEGQILGRQPLMNCMIFLTCSLVRRKSSARMSSLSCTKMLPSMRSQAEEADHIF